MTGYDQDIIAWANEQASLLRTGQFDQLDIAHLAEEIEDVGKSEQRELAQPYGSASGASVETGGMNHG